jgi:hypothetical protein
LGGRNVIGIKTTNACSLKKSGKIKLGNNWVVLLDNVNYLATYSKLLCFDLNTLPKGIEKKHPNLEIQEASWN